MNLTLSIDDRLVEKAREVARQQGTSLQALIRAFVERLAGQRGGEALAHELGEIWASGSGDSGGKRITRDDAYEGRL
jgi:hypothetical protein